VTRRILSLALACLVAGPCLAQTAPTAKPGAGNILAEGHGPLQVTADQGIEWQQNARAYIARGNAMAKRGDVTLRADTLTAYYRNAAHSGSSEIWRVVAEGHLKVTTPTQTLVADKGVYDLDQAVIVLTGKGLRLITPQDVVTARDSMEWYEDKQLAVARGDALAVHGDRRLHADTLAAQLTRDQAAPKGKAADGQAGHISRVDAVGHVLVSGPDQIGTGQSGVYDVEHQLATLNGGVTLTRGDNTLSGEYGVVDFKNNISRLLPRPGGVASASTGGASPSRVEGYLVPKPKPDTDETASTGGTPAPK
jgi:lipopolysaccharide export system protein LptA